MRNRILIFSFAVVILIIQVAWTNIFGQDSILIESNVITLSEIPREITSVNKLLLDKNSLHLTQLQRDKIGVETDTIRFRLNLLRENPRINRINSLNYRSLTDIENDWNILSARIISEQSAISQQVQVLETQKKLLDNHILIWENTLKSFANLDVPESVITQVNSTIESIGNSKSRMRDDSQFLQDKLVHISNGLIYCNQILEGIRVANDHLVKAFFELNQPPIWNVFSDKNDILVFAAQRSLIDDFSSEVKDFTSRNVFKIFIHAILFILLFLILKIFFKEVESNIPKDGSHGSIVIRKIVKRPFSSSVLITFLVTYILYDGLPLFLNVINFLIILIPVIFILYDILPESTRKLLSLPVIAITLLQIHSFGYSETVLSRIFLICIILFSSVSLVVIVQMRTFRDHSSTPGTGKHLYYFSLLSIILLSVSLLASLAGAVMLSEFITYGVVRSAALLLIIYALRLTINSILYTLVYSHALHNSNLVAQYHPVIYRKLLSFINFLSWFAWIALTLKLFNIGDDIYSGFKALLTNEMHIGTVTITGGSFILFIIIIWATIWISRMVKIVIEGEVAPRVKMKRGVPGAMALVLRIFVITVGFLFAIAAAGFGMDKFAILLGALGVGIGFGLQNIFNNLVSGIILAFERPIQEGDIIEVGNLWGTVKEIGIRASTIYTFEGAEVIVPNGNLISNELINWTLTDRNRRVEIIIGVAYGTDPVKVLEILRNVSEEHKEILQEPAPLALFTGFGDSSLDFKLLFWIPRADNRVIIQSEVNIVINNALKKAGIQIPFPQHDLHLKSVAPSVKDKFK